MDGAVLPPDRDPAARWCVLRMAAPRTLAVVAWLTEAGFTVWTPNTMIAPRMSGSKRRHDPRPSPLLATFAFAPYADVAELLRITRDPASLHPAFSLLRHQHDVVELHDRDLNGLRRHQEEKNGTAKVKRPEGLPVGSEVRPAAGPFGGVSGIVTSSDGRETYLSFGGIFGRVQIKTSKIDRGTVSAPASKSGERNAHPTGAALAA